MFYVMSRTGRGKTYGFKPDDTLEAITLINTLEDMFESIPPFNQHVNSPGMAKYFNVQSFDVTHLNKLYNLEETTRQALN